MVQGTYRHFKGNLYVALALVKHSETEEELVLYRPIDSEQLWVRTLALWTEHVERPGYSGPRFTKVSDDAPAIGPDGGVDPRRPDRRDKPGGSPA